MENRRKPCVSAELKKSFHQQHSTGAFDFTGDLAMQASGHASYAARQDFAAFGNKALEKIWVLVVDRFDIDIDAAAWHGPIGATEIGAALRSFGLHVLLFDFAMKGVAVEMGVELFLFEATWCARTFFVAGGDVARCGFALGFCLGAFECYVFLCHKFILCFRLLFRLLRLQILPPH